MFRSCKELDSASLQNDNAGYWTLIDNPTLVRRLIAASARGRQAALLSRLEQHDGRGASSEIDWANRLPAPGLQLKRFRSPEGYSGEEEVLKNPNTY